MMPFAGKIAIGGAALLFAALFAAMHASFEDSKIAGTIARYLITLGSGMLIMAFLLWLGMS